MIVFSPPETRLTLQTQARTLLATLPPECAEPTAGSHPRGVDGEPGTSQPTARNGNGAHLPLDLASVEEALFDIHRPFTLRHKNGVLVPAYRLEHLGDPGFCAEHGLRYPYVAGAMANGIGSADIVEAMGRAGMLAFFGAAGLSLRAVESAIDRITASLSDTPFGFNLIHTPNEPSPKAAVVDLFLRCGLRLVDTR